MNLVALTALIAVCGAAKLDRTYLPPASAKTAGGSPGSLQTPFSRSSQNNGLGGLPQGSYENDSQGVVVDAATAGTRASGVEATGLGGPRISYGSTASKVGAAAFKTKPSAFAQPQDESGSQFQQQPSQVSGTFQGQFPGASQGFANQGQISASQGPERPRAALDRAAGILRYENEVGPEGYHYAFETDNGITAEENGVATNGVQTQGGYSYTGDDGQVYSVSYTADEGGYQPKGDHLPTPPPIPLEILKSLEQNAKEEEAGLSDDGSYDAQKYNAGSDYSVNDGTNGKFTHQSSRFGGEADATASGTFVSQSNQPFRRPGQRGQSGQKGQIGQFGQSSSNAHDYDASEILEQGNAKGDSSQDTNVQAGSGFAGQFGQSANRGSGRFGQSSANGQGQANAFGSSNTQNGNTQSVTSFSGQTNRVQTSSNQGSSAGRFGQSGSGFQGQANDFGSYSSASQSGLNNGNRFGNRNEYLPPLKKPSQNGRPQNGRPINGQPQSGSQASISAETSAQDDKKTETDVEGSPNFVPLGQQALQSESHPQGAFTSFGKPISSQNEFASVQNKPTNGRRPSINANFAQAQSSQSGNRFGTPNEYLPPSNEDRKPVLSQPQNIAGSQFSQQAFGNIHSSQTKPQGSSFASTGSQSSFGSSFESAQPTFATQPQQTNAFQRPQSTRPGQTGNRFQAHSQMQFGTSGTFGARQPIKATTQPDTELTTPLETSVDEVSQTGQSAVSSFASSGSRPTNERPAQPSFGSQLNTAQSSFGSQLNSRPQISTSRPFGQPSAFPTQAYGQFNQNQFGSQSQSSFGQNGDAQFASSTQRPSYTQQPQGADDSYYYNQPSKPFGTSQGSRFPSAPSNQFDRVNQQASFAQSQFSSPSDVDTSPTHSSGQFQGSNKYQQPPTIAPGKPLSQSQTQFGSPNQFGGQFSGSTKYPKPPTIAPTAPSSAQTHSQGNAVNGVTQASTSSFPSQSPTQSSQFGSQGQFGARPSFQQSQASSSFGTKPTQPSFGQQSSTSPFTRPGSSNFQTQSQFSQQSQKEETNENAPEQQVSSQQYSGEIYEYNKPAQTLPPPDSTPASSTGTQKVKSQGQFGAQSSRPQLGQTNDEEDQRPVSQFGTQASTVPSSRPQFVAPSRPTFGQSTQSNFGAQSMKELLEDSKPYSALAQSLSQTSQQSGSRPQFGAQRPSIGQTQSLFDGQSEENSSDAPAQSSCCKTLPSFDRKPQGQGSFGQNFPGSQSFKPEPTSSFAGQGEQFGGPRAPPSFDEETGYHY